MRRLVVCLLFALAAPAVADYVQPAAETSSTSTPAPSTITVDVQNVVPDRQLTIQEQRFINTVPERDASGTWGIHKAVHEMLLAGVIHVPPCGRYISSWEKEYWRAYQVWTARKVVQVPIIQGPSGPPGRDGLDGRDGRDCVPPPPCPPPPCHHRLALRVVGGPQADRYSEYRQTSWEIFWGHIRDLIPIGAAAAIRPSRVEVTQTGGGATAYGGNSYATGGSSRSLSSSASSASASAAAAASADP